MPKTILNYEKTIMYKIVCDDLTIKDCYVGHTTNMTKRKYKHKTACNNEKNKAHNRKIYQIIRQNGGWSNWSMLLIETFPCKDKHEACKREREIFEELDAKMNMVKPYRTQEEIKLYYQDHKEDYKKYYKDHKEDYKKYYQDHKEENKEYYKKYYQDHKEEIKEYYKKYYQDHKEEIKLYYQDHKEQAKEYYKKYYQDHKEENKLYQEANKQEIAEKKKQYYRDHKEQAKLYYQIHKAEIAEKYKEKKTQCEYCSKLLSKQNITRHHDRCKSKSNSICL